MRTVVKEMPRFRADLVRLLERRLRNPLDALAIGQAYLADMTAVLEKYGGPPEDAEVLRRDREGLWWLYTDGVWVGLSITEVKRRLWTAAVRTVTLIAVAQAPPAGPSPAA